MVTWLKTELALPYLHGFSGRYCSGAERRRTATAVAGTWISGGYFGTALWHIFALFARRILGAGREAGRAGDCLNTQRLCEHHEDCDDGHA